MESFEEFCEGWIGMKGRIWKRSQLFTADRLREQYDQLQRAMECNRRRGAVVDGHQHMEALAE